MLVALALVAGACSDDDAASPTTTAATSSGPPETTAPVTTVPATTTAPTTAAPATTQSADALNAEVTAAFLALEDKNLALLMNPRAPDVPAQVAAIAVPGSPYAQRIEARVAQLAANHQSVRLNTPDMRKVTIESVVVLDADQTHVNVTVCQVGNAILVKDPDSSGIPGRSIPVGSTGELSAARYTVDLLRTDAGWRHSSISDPNSPVWVGASECPPS
jgi:hypothetical protein